MHERQSKVMNPFLAMIGMVGFVMGSGPIADGELRRRPSTDEVEIRIADNRPVERENLVFRAAKRPIVVPISFAITDGKPRLQQDASAAVLQWCDVTSTTQLLPLHGATMKRYF